MQNKGEAEERRSSDRRVQRTRQSLRAALIALILEKGYEDVTVQDIIDRANVGRSTFYAHFLDKEDLLISGFAELRKAFEDQHQASIAGTSSRPSEHFAVSLAVFRHAGQHYQLYKAMVGRRSGDLVLKYARQYLADLTRDHFGKMLPPAANPAVPLDALVEFLVSALLSLLIWWLDNDMPCSAEQIDAMFRRLVMPGLLGALGQPL